MDSVIGIFGVSWMNENGRKLRYARKSKGVREIHFLKKDIHKISE